MISMGGATGQRDAGHTVITPRTPSPVGGGADQVVHLQVRQPAVQLAGGDLALPSAAPLAGEFGDGDGAFRVGGDELQGNEGVGEFPGSAGGRGVGGRVSGATASCAPHTVEDRAGAGSSARGRRLARALQAGALPLGLCAGAAQGAGAALRADLRPWVPPGWGLIASARGDLDGDGRADTALVLQKQDASRVRPVDGPGGPQVDLNERRLQVLLARPGGGYRAVFTSDKTLPPEGDEDNPCVVDPFLERHLRIRHGLLVLRFDHWASCGSWGRSSSQWKFRFDPARPGLRVIGYDATQSTRNAPGMNRLSVDLLQGRFWARVSPEEGVYAGRRSWQGRLLGNPVLYLGDTLPECRVVEGDDSRCGSVTSGR